MCATPIDRTFNSVYQYRTPLSENSERRLPNLCSWSAVRRSNTVIPSDVHSILNNADRIRRKGVSYLGPLTCRRDNLPIPVIINNGLGFVAVEDIGQAATVWLLSPPLLAARKGARLVNSHPRG